MSHEEPDKLTGALSVVFTSLMTFDTQTNEMIKTQSCVADASVPYTVYILPSFRLFLQLATWDSVHGLNGSLKESRIENGMQGVTVKVVTLLVGDICVKNTKDHILC